jgi:AraC-like DNA-binding protein
MDALSDVLKSIRLEGAVFLNVEFTEPWCVQARFGMACISDKLARAEHVMFFHYIVEGRAKLRLDKGGDVINAVGGDLVLFAQDEAHIMGSDLQLAPFDAGRIEGADATDTDFLHLRHGGGGAPTRYVCGYVACSKSVVRPLLESLPPMLRIPMGSGPAGTMTRELLRMGVRESSSERPGSASTLAKLTELIFVEAMRTHVENLPAEGKGWLAGVRDVQVGRALSLMHSNPDKAWTVDTLARESAISRSALAERFTALVGESPMKYLTRWRLALAAQRLRSTRETVARIADRSGYESEAAFNRAFKREFGVPPASWRRNVPR